MIAGLVIALRCALAVAATTVAVQLWGMALQDDVPLPAPIFSPPAADAAVAAATPRPRVHRIRPAIVVSAGLVAAAQRPRPALRPEGDNGMGSATPPATPQEGRNEAPVTAPPPMRKPPDLAAPPRPTSPEPAPGSPSSSPETVPLSPPPMPVEPPDLHVAPLAPRAGHAGPEDRSHGGPAEAEDESGHDDHSP